MLSFEESIASIEKMMDDKRREREILLQEWHALDSAKKIYLAAQRKHHEFNNEEEMREAMLKNFNPFDTFSIVKRKKK